MSVFNPSPGVTQDPNYLSYPRVIEGPSLVGDTSSAQTIKAVGEGISDATSIVDAGIKKTISNDIYEKVDKERDAFTAGLQHVKSDLDNGMIAPAVRSGVGGTTGSSLIMDASQDTQELPAGLESGLSRVQQLAAAKAAGSPKLNDTQYSAQVLSIAKQLRSQYGTGYREYIDDTVSKASGLPVANSYYQNLMLDINRQLNQIGKTKDDVGALMMKNLDVPGDPKAGVPNMGAYIALRAAKDPRYPGDAAMLSKISDWQNLQSQQKIDAATRAEKKDREGDQAVNAEKDVTKNLNNLVNHHIEDNMTLSGAKDFRQILNIFSDASANPGKYSSVEIQALVPQLSAYRQQIYMEGHKMITESAPEIGMKKAEDLLTASLAPIDTYIKLATDKETGPAFYAFRQAAAIKEDDNRNWLIDKDKGAVSRQLMTARGILGEQGFAWYLPSMINAGADKPFTHLFEQEALAAVAPVYDEKGQIYSRSMVDAIQHAKQLKNPDGTPAIAPEFYGKITGWLEKMNDPNMPLKAKDNMVKWAFQKPGVMDELAMDYRDPKTNQIVPGKYRALNLMASDRNIQSVAETAKIHPENYTMLKGWTESEFGKLFRADLQNLNKATQNPELKLHYSYDDTTKQFGLVDNNNRPITRDSRLNVINPNPAYHAPEYKSYINSTLDILDRVNSGTQRLRSVYTHNPVGDSTGSVDRYLLQTMQTSGMRPGDKLQGAPAEMAKALIKTAKPDATPEELNKLLMQ